MPSGIRCERSGPNWLGAGCPAVPGSTPWAQSADLTEVHVRHDESCLSAGEREAYAAMLRDADDDRMESQTGLAVGPAGVRAAVQRERRPAAAEARPPAPARTSCRVKGRRQYGYQERPAAGCHPRPADQGVPQAVADVAGRRASCASWVSCGRSARRPRAHLPSGDALALIGSARRDLRHDTHDTHDAVREGVGPGLTVPRQPRDPRPPVRDRPRI